MIITSLLDNDLYKFTMLQAFLHYNREVPSKYEFICRTRNVNFSKITSRLMEEADHLCTLRFTEDELFYLESTGLFNKLFISFLREFKLDRNNIEIRPGEGGNLAVEISAPVVNASLFEVPVLSIISELYSKSIVDEKTAAATGREWLERKLRELSGFPGVVRFADFGTRRRYSFIWQGTVIERLVQDGYKGFIGTSNVFYAKKFNIRPVGTMAHEWIMAHAGITGLENSTRLALERWLQFYGAKLGIALTDTYTTDSFIKDFDRHLAANYNGLRHDSGDWKSWGYKILKHYRELGIDPAAKTLVFSDCLDFDKIYQIHREFNDRTNLLFGIGTNLTNDVGMTPLQIVIKMTEFNSRPLIKISDDPDKILCNDPALRKQAMKLFHVN